MSGSVRRRNAVLAGGVLLAFVMGLALRLRLGSTDYWFNPDEGLYHRVATIPSAAEANAMILGLAHPPLHYWMLRAMTLVGEDPRTLRLPSLVTGLLAILAFAWLGSETGSAEERALGSMAGAWFGAFVAALSPGLALQSVTMRQYSQQALALAIGLAALLRYRETGRARWLVLSGASLTAAVLLVYTSYLVVGGVGIVLLVALLAGRLSRRQVAGLVCAVLPVLLAMAWSFVTHLKPHLVGGAAHREAQETWLRSQYVAGPLAGVDALLQAARHAYSGALRPLVLIPVLVSIGLAVRRRRGLAAFVALAVAGLAVVLSWSGLVPLGGSRHALYLVAVQVAAGAAGTAWLVGRVTRSGAPGAEAPRQRRARIALTVGLAVLLVGSFGTYLVRLARAGASGAIDLEDEERVVRRSSVVAVSAFIRRSPTAWITDMQTSMLLLPLAPREERVLPLEPAFGGRRLEALGHSFAVVWTWLLPEAPDRPDDPVERALTWIAGQGGFPPGRIGIVTGGWGPSAAWRIARDLRTGGPDGAVVDAAGDEHLAAVVVDVEALRAWRRRRADEIALTPRR